MRMPMMPKTTTPAGFRRIFGSADGHRPSPRRAIPTGSAEQRPILSGRDGRAAALSLALTALGLFGCAGPGYAPKARAEFATALEASEDTAWTHALAELRPVAPTLDSLQAQARRANPDYLAAFARLRQAEAGVLAQTGALLPSVAADASASRGDTPVTGPDGVNFVTVDQYKVSLAAQFELDVWGKLWRGRKAAVRDAEAARLDAAAMAVTLDAAVSDAYFAWIAQARTADRLAAQVRTAEEYLEILLLRQGQGLNGALDAVQQRQQLESLRGRLVLAEGQRDQSARQLRILTGLSALPAAAATGRGADGAAPQSFAPQPFAPPGATAADARDTLPEPAPLPDLGIPSDWLQRRPDVRAAYLRLEASEQRAIAASLDRLPSLRLSGSLFTQALEWSDLFSEWLQSVSASASQTVFAGGRKQAALKLAEAQAEERWQAYRKAALQAGKEILDALDGERRQQEYRRHLEAQAQAAHSALDLARDRYANGAADFLRVLNAEQSWQQLELSLIEARRNRLTLRRQLLRALGDGAQEPLAQAKP